MIPANTRLKLIRFFRKLARTVVKQTGFGIANIGQANMRSEILQHASAFDVIPDIHPDDLIFQFLIKNPVFENNALAVKYYFSDGANSAKKLGYLLFSQLGMDQRSDTSILEFASGYGCVTRQLVRELSPVNIVSCDIHEAACSFINSAMGVKTILSARIPEDLKVGNNSFDVVFALSFFSHMPNATWGRWLKVLFEKVRPGGFLIFTTQGMISRKYFGYPDIPDSGIWFTPSSEQKDLDIADYGNTIVTADYVKKVVENTLNQYIFYTAEAFWWEHQDLYVINKPVLN